MKNTEIIEKLKGYKGIIMYPTDEAEALKDAAIKALSQEPCDDAVSRDAVIEATYHCGDLQEVRGVVQQLPSVTQKSGKWRHYENMLTCSQCKAEFYDEIMEYCGDDVPRFCLNCGAKMESEE